MVIACLLTRVTLQKNYSRCGDRPKTEVVFIEFQSHRPESDRSSLTLTTPQISDFEVERLSYWDLDELAD